MEPLNESETKFYKTLQSKLQLVYLYENINLLKDAASAIPTEELNMKATLKLSMIENTKESETEDFEDLLLLELLNWFKFSFFNWVDKPKCESCGQIPQNNGIVPPDENEEIWGASTVETYFCVSCQLNIRFPRYNHPKKLLETRCGRCGEWANCFTFLCRALGYDARLVFDWNDHVWTEVFSFSKNRWLHCDPCENVCDKPLLYEIGWKKPISYVIAFSKDEVQDVTWRYTSKFGEVLNRRNLCRENWIMNCILALTKKLQRNASAERKTELTKRRVVELAHFLTEPKADESLGGRISGSLAWRLARGETPLTSTPNAFIFKLNENEIQKKHFHIKYNCASDKYIRVSDDSVIEEDGWSACAYSYSNIIRKVELDWKMVYLARIEGSSKGLISWKLDFTNSGLAVQNMNLRLNSMTYDCGDIKWIIDSGCEKFPKKIYDANDSLFFQTQDFKGCTSFAISAELTKGTGNVAWQHTQLFRQALDSAEFPFEIEIYLDKL